MAHHNRGFLRILMALVMITTMFGGMYIPQAAPAGAQEAAATPVTLAEDEPDPPAPGGSVTVTVADSVTGSPVSTASVDDELSVTVEIHNTGNVSISNLSIASLVFASGPAPVFGLEPTQTTSKAYIYTVTAADLAAGSKAFEFWVSSNEISPPMYGTATISVIEPEPPAENTPTQPAATSEPPIATHEDLTIVPGTTVTIDVVANDFDPDTVHADLTISLDPSQPPHWGSVELDPENPHQIIYTAPPGVLGDDWFAYLLSDGVNTVQGVVIFRYRGEQSLRVEMTDPTGYAPARLCVQLTFYYPDGSGSMTFYPFCGDPADPWNVTIDGLVEGNYWFNLVEDREGSFALGSSPVEIGNDTLTVVSANVAVEAEYGWVIVRATNEDASAPVTGACWQIERTDSGPVYVPDACDVPGVSGHAGASGFYGLEPGEHLISPAAGGAPDGYEPAAPRTVNVTAGQITVVDIAHAPLEPTPTEIPTEEPATPIVPTPDPEGHGSLNIRVKDAATGAPADFCIDINIAGDDYYYCAVGIDPPEIDLADLPAGTYDIMISPNNGPGFDPKVVEDVVVTSDDTVNLLVDVESTAPDLGMQARISLSVVYPEMAFPGDVVTITFVADSGAFLVGDLTVSATIGESDPVSCLIPAIAAYSSGSCSVDYTVSSDESAPALGVAAQVTSALLPASISLYEEFLIGEPITLRVQAIDQMASLIPGACFDIQNWAAEIHIFDRCEPTGELVLADTPPGEYILTARTPDGEISNNTWLYLEPGSGEHVARLMLTVPTTSGFLEGRIELYGAPDFNVGETIEAVFVLTYSGYVPLRNVRIEMDSEVFRQTCDRPSVISSTLCYWVWTPTALDVGRSVIVTVTVTADGLDEPLVLPALVRVLPIDDNTPIGSPVQVFPYGMPGAWVTFEQVDTAGRTSYARTDYFERMSFEPLYPGAFGRVYELVTTAEYDGSFELCQPYWMSDFGDPRLLAWDGSNWSELDAVVTPGSGGEGTICATASETGIFAVVSASNALPPYADTLEVTVLAGVPTSIDVLEKVTDEDTPRGDLTVALHPSTMPALGTVEIDPDDPQRVIYNTLGNSLGMDYFAVQVSDGVYTTFAWVYVTIAGPHTLSMTLTDPTGYAPALVRVELYQVTDDGEQFVREQEVDATEPHVVDFTGLVAGEYRYAVLSNLYEGADHGGGTVTVGGEPITSIDVQIGVDPNFGWLIVRSLDEDGTHLLPGGCWLLALEEGSYVRCDRPETEARVGIAGYYRVPAGEWELSQYDFGAPGGFAAASPRIVTIEAGQVTVVSISHQPADVLEIVGIDTLDLPVTGFCAAVSDEYDWLFTRCDSEDGLPDGLIRLPQLAAGDYGVVISPDWNETRRLISDTFAFTVAPDGSVDAGDGGNQLPVLFEAGGRAIVSVNAVAAMSNLCIALIQHDPSGASAPVSSFGGEHFCGYFWPFWDPALQEYIVPAHSIDMTQIPSGEYTIVMLTHGVSIVSGATLVVPPGETVNHAITVEAVAGPRALVMAEVLDADGNPVTQVEAGDELEITMRFFNTGTVVLTNPAWVSSALGAGPVGNAQFAPSTQARTEVILHTVTAADVEGGQFEIDIAFTADGLTEPATTQVVLAVEGYIPPTPTPTEVMPAMPEIGGNTCIAGVFTPPVVGIADTDAIAYQIEQPVEANGWMYTITAVIDDSGYGWDDLESTGWLIIDATTAIYEGQVTPAYCEVVVPAMPQVMGNACVEGVFLPPTVTIGESYGVLTTIVQQPTEGNAWTYVVAAVISGDGFAWGDLAGGWVPVSTTAAELVGSVAPDYCEPVLPAAPVIAGNVCVDGVFTPPVVMLADSDAIQYQISQPTEASSWTYSVTATITGDGYDWGDLAGTGWVKATPVEATYAGLAAPDPCSVGSGLVRVETDVTVAEPGDEVDVRVEVENDGDVTLTNLWIMSSMFGSGLAPVATLDPGETTVKMYTYTVQPEDGEFGSVTFAFHVSANELPSPLPGEVTIMVMVPTPTAEPPTPTAEPPTPTAEAPTPTVEPATPEPATPEPATPEPATPEPATPEPATPEPATPEPATPEPATPEPGTPEPVEPGVTLDKDRATPGSNVEWAVEGFTPGANLVLTWQSPSGASVALGEVVVSEDGTASGVLKVPTVPGGVGHLVRFSTGPAESVARGFEVASRIAITPAQAVPGQIVNVNLRGFTASETVSLRWRVGSTWIAAGTTSTNSNGSRSNISLMVPAPAPFGPIILRVDGTISQQTSALTIIKPTATLDPVRATVGTSITFTLSDFPADSEVSITWRRLNGAIVNIGTAQTDASGGATGAFDVPTVDGGPGQQVIFTTGVTSATASFEIAPRIRIVPTTARPGDTISMNLRGFTRNDPVTIYWMNGEGALVPVATATTNSNGNVTGLEIVTPSWAPNGTNKIRVDGVIDQQSSALTVQRPTVTVDRTSGTPGVSVGYEAINFPANSVVSITWRRLTGTTIDLGTVTTDATGSATGSFKIPATPGGPGQIVTFTAGTVAETVTLEVKPRIKVTPATAGRGETIDISLRGFARQEAVVIRWRPGTSGPFQTIATGTTSNTGSANISFTVPASAADGSYQVRAESASFNQQTSAFAIAGGQPVVLAAVDAGEPPATGELPPAIWLAGAPAVVRRAKPWRGKWLSA